MRHLLSFIYKCATKSQLYTVCRVKIKEFLCLSLTLFTLFFILSSAHAGGQPNFPQYSVIRSNVHFWEKIYGHYSENDAIVHDRVDLSVIYETIPLLDKNLPGAGRVNGVVRKITVEKYRSILEKLSTGVKPQNKNEQRVYNLFKGKNKKQQFQVAADNIRIQTGLKERFRQGVIRSGRYITEIKKVLIAHGLPMEIAYLPHVESSFDNRAHSSSGAQGMWQFTRGTGKQYLQINSVIDERRDPILAAEAASRYLTSSYKSLGTWPLALTSYNYGPAGMLRAAKAEGSYEKIFANYNEGHFKFASRNFYSEFLAAYKVALQIEKTEKKIIQKPQRNYYLTVPHYISLAALGRHFKLPPRIIGELNPALLSPILKGNKYIPPKYKLRLPRTKRVGQRLHSIPRSEYKAHQKISGFYIVKHGDTVSSIAARHNVTLGHLLKINNLHLHGKIYAQQKLKIP